MEECWEEQRELSRVCSLPWQFALNWMNTCVNDLHEYINYMQKTQRYMGKIDSVLYVRINIQNDVNLELVNPKWIVPHVV